MKTIINTALDTFQNFHRFDKDGLWIYENIQSLIEYIYPFESGKEVTISEFVTNNYDKDKLAIVFGKIIPYLTGGYGLLNMNFETFDGRLVNVRDWLEAKNLHPGIEIKCIAEDGEELIPENVNVVFRRNDRQHI